MTPRVTLASFISVPDVYPIGRLDYDSEGLLLLTNDGALQHRLSEPSFAHPRTYWVQVEGTVSNGALKRLREGVVIQSYRTRPARAEALSDPQLAERQPSIRFRAEIPTSWLELTLTEGRNRQVRRMTAAVGFPTLRLVRVGIGPLRLHGLGLGCWRDVESDELRNLRDVVGSKQPAMYRKQKGRPL